MRDDTPTDRQDQILRAIRNWIVDHGQGPSIRQIGELVGLSSPATVDYHLKRLEKRGLISRDRRRRHSIRLGS